MTSERVLGQVVVSHGAAQNTLLGNALSNYTVSGKNGQSYFSGHSDWSKMDRAGDADGAHGAG